MPGWNIHLEVGRKVNEKLKFSGKQKEEFLFGCILPDINNGYINKKIKTIKDHGVTHWAFDEKSSLNFYEKYKREIRNKEPIYLGYLLHLYTDGFFNYSYYSSIDHDARFEGLDDDKKVKNKHHDFWKYELKLRNQSIRFLNKKELVGKANKIKEIKIDEDEIKEIEDLLNDAELNVKLAEGEYIYYSEKELDFLVDDVVNKFLNQYFGDSDA